ncbi:MAG TPA: hypothetical protein VM576_07420 [Xanthomonadaceae bacterium]|nr:hypothetical protein [Xanthomonadaceae bacterium]
MRPILLLVLVATLTGCKSIPSAVDPAPAAFAGAPVPGGRASDDPMFRFDGAWEGVLTGHGGPDLVDGAGMQRAFRIEVGAGQARVFQQLRGQWSEMKPGTFTVSAWGSQAVLYSLTSGQDEDGTWVEGSSFTLVRTSPDAVVAYWLRTVNNLDLPQEHPDHHFAWEFSGEMRKAAD